jgi:hypothetical protein
MKERAVGRKKQDVRLVFPKHLLKPEDFLHFVELPEFSGDWDALGLNDEEDLTLLQMAIMANPKGAPVVRGTGGLRKLRFAPGRWNCGKSGAARVCYVYLETHWTVVLMMVYGKGAKESLTSEEKSLIKREIEQINTWMDARNY